MNFIYINHITLHLPSKPNNYSFSCTTISMEISTKAKADFKVPTKCKQTETSSDRTERKVPVVYYLSRNGNLDHPHFIEVPLSSNTGLYLKDVINRLNILRGKSMASMYSWSSKRSYKNGFVWQDLCENDFIYPSRGQEYVLKGSEVLKRFLSVPAASSSSQQEYEPAKTEENCSLPIVRRRNQSWNSVDLNEYKVYKAESEKAIDAATQTRRQRRRMVQEKETLESLMKADGSVINGLQSVDETDQTVKNCSNGKTKASTVLLQVISCGALREDDVVKDKRFSLIPHWKMKLQRGVGNRVRLEGGEYFSGSLLIGRNKEKFPALRRSASCSVG